METKDTKITIGDVTLWTRPWGDGKAILTANEPETNRWLYKVHTEHPEYFEILQDDEDFCEEDLEGSFSLIVDPEKAQLLIGLGDPGIGFRIGLPIKEESNDAE